MQKPNHPPDVITLDQVDRKSIEIEVETYLKLPLSIICSTWNFTFKQFFSVDLGKSLHHELTEWKCEPFEKKWEHKLFEHF